MRSTTANVNLTEQASPRFNITARTYLSLVELLGLVVISYAIREALLRGTEQWIYLAVLTVVASLMSTQISKRGTAAGSVTISLGDFFVFFAMVTLGPLAAALMGAIEGLVSSLRVRTKYITKILFNMSQLALTSFLAGLLVSYLRGPEAAWNGSGLSMSNLVILLGCGVGYFLLNSLLVATAMRLVSKQSSREIGGKGFIWAFPTIALNSVLVVILLSSLGPVTFGLALALAPLLIVTYLLTGVRQTDEGSSLFGAAFLPQTFEIKAKAYLVGTIMAAIPIYLYCLHQSVTGQSWNWLYLAALGVLASCFPIRLFSLSDRLWLTLGDLFVFVALFHFGVEVAVVVASLEAIAFNLRSRARPAYRWMFNLAEIVLVAFLVGQFFALLQTGLSRPGGLGLSSVVMLLVALWLVGFLYYVLSSTLTGLAIAWSSRQSFYLVWTKNLRWCAMSIAGSMIAALTFVFYGCFPW